MARGIWRPDPTNWQQWYVPGKAIVDDSADNYAVDMAGTAAGTSTAVGTMLGPGTMTGVSHGTSTAVVTGQGLGAMSGSCAGTSTVVGTVAGSGALTGTSAGSSTAYSTLSGLSSGQLAGESDGTSTAVGTMSGLGAMTGISTAGVNPYVFTIYWDASASTDVLGYKVYIGVSTGVYGGTYGAYTSPVDEGLVLQATFTALPGGVIYYLAVTAYNSYGESGFSNEISVAVPIWKPQATISNAAGVMTGSSASTSTASATLKGTGAMTGSSAGSATASATMVINAMSGESDATSTAVATMAGAGALTGTSAAAATAYATMTFFAQNDLSGLSVGSSNALATMGGIGNMMGRCDAVAVCTLVLVGSGAMTGVSHGVAALSGRMISASVGTSSVIHRSPKRDDVELTTVRRT